MKRFVAILIMGTLCSFIFSPTQASAQGTWKQLPVTPTTRTENLSALLDGKIYVLGEFTPKGATTRIDVNYHNNLNSNESYDPKTKKWMQHAPLPTARSGIALQFLNGWIHVFSDESGEGTFVENEAYNPETNKWKTFNPIPSGLHGLASVFPKGKTHILNGGPYPGGGGSNHHLLFSP